MRCSEKRNGREVAGPALSPSGTNKTRIASPNPGIIFFSRFTNHLRFYGVTVEYPCGRMIAICFRRHYVRQPTLRSSVSMRYRAISDDVGTFFVRQKATRPNFDEALAKREIAVIKHELHCNAVRIFGQDIDRLIVAATIALTEGLTVWLS